MWQAIRFSLVAASTGLFVNSPSLADSPVGAYFLPFQEFSNDMAQPNTLKLFVDNGTFKTYVELNGCLEIYQSTWTTQGDKLMIRPGQYLVACSFSRDAPTTDVTFTFEHNDEGLTLKDDT